MDSKRCPCWTQHPLMREYHDNEWGRPVHSDRKHFEMIVLEVMQCGLNWLMILQKREVFRRCFQEFSPEKAAAFTEEDVERILGTEGMIRSACKIRAVIQNAQKFLEIAAEYGSFDNYLWGFTGGKTLIYPENIPEPFPAKNKLSDEISRDLKKRGFQYLGSLTVYAHLQACGLINDHDRSCPMFKVLCKAYPHQYQDVF